MWYVHNNEVIVFMHDNQQEVDADILTEHFPQSYSPGQCKTPMHVIDTNVPFVISTGERVDGENPRGETQRRIDLRLAFFKQLLPLKRNRRVVSITALISPVYGAQLIIDDGKTTKQTRTVSEQTLFRVMGLCSKPNYVPDHKYEVGNNPHLLYGGAAFHLIIARKEQDSAK